MPILISEKYFFSLATFIRMENPCKLENIEIEFIIL